MYAIWLTTLERNRDEMVKPPPANRHRRRNVKQVCMRMFYMDFSSAEETVSSFGAETERLRDRNSLVLTGFCYQ